MKLYEVIAFIIQIQVLSLDSAATDLNDWNDFDVAAKRVKRSGSNRTCIRPPITPDKEYIVQFPYQHEVPNTKPGEEVPEYTSIIAECNKDYTEDNEDYVSKPTQSVCVGGTWVPPILKCKRICRNFTHFSNFNMTCHRRLRGQKIPCTGILVERAIAKPRCQKHFRPHINVNYKYATCTANGKWDKEFFKCVPDCGVADNSVGNIAYGYRERRGGAPWYVAIYSSEFSPKKPLFICGGTLITAELVISAAHCFYDATFRYKPDIGYYYAIVGKVTSDFEKLDFPTITKTLKVKNISYPDVTFNPAVTNYAGDIVVLQLSERVDFSSDVFPACLYWDDRNRFIPNKNEMGKLSGFGETENGTLALELLSAKLPAMSYSECLTKVREDFQGSISVDKFCAGARNGTAAGKGDSGGGLLFVDRATGLYHLRGVVSNTDSRGSSISTFTDVAQYTSWILQILKDAENKSADSAAKCDDSIDCVDESDESDLEYQPQINKESSSKRCKSNEFQCTSGSCIDRNLACNGQRDCDDGTDEMTKHCENNQCSKNQFRCGYGACIDSKLKCDGVKNCQDGSDEFSDLCEPLPTSTPTPISNRNSIASEFCTLPPTSEDKSFTIKCLNDGNCNHKPGENVPQYTEMSFKCNLGYQYDDSRPFVSICINGVWTPRIANCTRACPNFSHFSNFDMTCYEYFGGPRISCTGQMLQDAIVIPKCKNKFRPSVNVNYIHATCLPDGRWDKEFFKCIPECGAASVSVGLIANGYRERRGGSPWYVAIYNSERDPEKPSFHCGGTLISAKLVISTAHCFYNEYLDQKADIEHYYAIVGKATPDFKTKDYSTTKVYMLKNVYFPDKMFRGVRTNYVGNIAVLQLSEKVEFSQDVFPACLYWDDRVGFNPSNNDTGKLSGFGKTENGSFSSVLRSANLPTIDYGECLKIVSDDFRTLISADKFCAGSVNALLPESTLNVTYTPDTNPSIVEFYSEQFEKFNLFMIENMSTGVGASRGDGGGGLLFVDDSTGLYHLRGVVSNKDLIKPYIAAFTDVSQYMSWIVEIMKSVQNESAVTSCEEPRVPRRGFFTGYGFNAYSVIKFHCESRYLLVGPSEIMCTAEGKWNDTIPKCVPT